MTSPTAAFIIIGNEILSGRTEDRNLNFLAKELGKMGIVLHEVRVVLDIESAIITAVNSLRVQYDYIFTSGGIGPTHDDITSASIAKAFDVALICDPEAVRRLETHYGKEGINDARLKMAHVPEGAQLLDNPISSAPGYYMENVYVMAGVPKIMQAMFFCLKPTLHTGKPIVSEEISIYASESSIATLLDQLQQRYPHTDIGSYPFAHYGRYGVGIVIKGTHQEDIQSARNELIATLKSINTEFIEQE